MKFFARKIGQIAFWLSWPVNYVYLRRTERTRVLVVAEGKALVVQNWHSAGAWSLPGGGIHKNEDPAFAATRELMEETTIALGIDQLQFLTKGTYHSHGLRFTCHYFAATPGQVIEAQARLPEVLEARWIRLDELSNYKLGADTTAALACYNKP